MSSIDAATSNSSFTPSQLFALAVIVTLPRPLNVTNPAEFTVATSGAFEYQFTPAKSPPSGAVMDAERRTDPAANSYTPPS